MGGLGHHVRRPHDLGGSVYHDDLIRIHSLLVLLPFSIRDMQGMLSWYTVDVPCAYPCAVRKFPRCNNMLVGSDVATSSASVLDLVKIDCLVDSTDTGPLSPMVKHAPVCDFPSSWIP